jgi:hypothetical protein
MENGRIHDGSGRDLDALARQMMVHRLQHLLAQLVLLQQLGGRSFGKVRQLQPMHMRTNTISRRRIALLL